MRSATSTALRFTVAGMIAMAVAMGIGRFVYTPILPGMMEELHLSPANAGWIASANYLGYLIGAFVAAGGWAHGRERLLMLGSLGASTVLAALMGLTDAMVAFLLIRFLAGLASAFVMVFMASIVFSHIGGAGHRACRLGRGLVVVGGNFSLRLRGRDAADERRPAGQRPSRP
ncbi:MFS family permease [Mesorhizobium sp. USDA 4775]